MAPRNGRPGADAPAALPIRRAPSQALDRMLPDDHTIRRTLAYLQPAFLNFKHPLSLSKIKKTHPSLSRVAGNWSHKNRVRLCLTRVIWGTPTLRWFIPFFHLDEVKIRNRVKQETFSPKFCNHQIWNKRQQKHNKQIN